MPESDVCANASSQPAGFLLAGCYRSGTTLLEKLLHAHPRASVASQPFPLLYFHVKEAFLRHRGLERRYPVGHRFGEGAYTLEELGRFLDGHVIGGAEIAALARRMAGYAEQRWTPQLVPLLSRLRPGTFLTLWRQLNGLVARSFAKPSLALAGTKEVLCEEFVPYLLDRGARAAIVVRDPRDVISSYNFRRRATEIESNRPILFTVRIWRKSVALALACAGRDGFSWLRYEDLSHAPLEELNRVARALGLGRYPGAALRSPLRAQDGTVWSGNSSFEPLSAVSTSSVGRFREVLPRATLEFVEYLCAPELRALGYEPATGAVDDPSALERFAEPVEDVHPRFEAGYSTDPSRLDQEVRRRELLARAQPLEEPEARRWFVEPAAYRQLRAVGVGTSRE